MQHPVAASAVGALATLTMDAGALLGSRLGLAGGGPRRTGPDVIGRWVGYMAKGRFRQRDILLAPPLPYELPLGLFTHYGIGITLALAYLGGLSRSGIAPTVLTGLAYGVATTVLAWFLMLPSQGMGWLGAQAPAPAKLTRFSLYNHVIFGLGLALWTAVLRPLS